jgi:hypothetical protein
LGDQPDREHDLFTLDAKIFGDEAEHEDHQEKVERVERPAEIGSKRHTLLGFGPGHAMSPLRLRDRGRKAFPCRP